MDGVSGTACRGQESGLLALDTTHIYWLEEFGSALFRVRKEGGNPEQMMAGNGDPMLHVPSLAVDEGCVYWTVAKSRTAGGAVFKMAK